MDGWEQLVHCQFERIIEHAWQKHLQELVRLLKTWVGVHLDQPWVQQVVDHEVITENFKAELPVVLVHLLTNRCEGQLHDGHYLLLEDLVEIHLQVVFFSQAFLSPLQTQITYS